MLTQPENHTWFTYKMKAVKIAKPKAYSRKWELTIFAVYLN